MFGLRPHIMEGSPMVVDEMLLLILLLLSLVGFVLALFLPSLLEIWKPKDNGPRKMRERTLEHLGVKVQRANGEIVRVQGDLNLPNDFKFEENIVVKGSLSAGNGCHFSRSVKVSGNVALGTAVLVDENLIVEGDVQAGDDAVIGGSIDAGGSVKLGEKAFVRGSVVAGGNVELFENCEVTNGILCGKSGAVKVLKVPSVEFPSSIEDVG